MLIVAHPLRKRALALAVVAVVVASGCTASDPNDIPPISDARTIALTFDDVTRGDGPFLSGVERTPTFIATLEQAGVTEAMFFVTTGNVEREGESGSARVRLYSAAGHVLGNHSHSHSWLSRSDTHDYIADFDRAQSLLANYDSVLPYYRFPYLDEGRSVEKRDRLRAALSERGIRNGYVTVDTYDWYLDQLALEQVEAGVEVDRVALKNLYVDVIVKSVEFYDAMAQRTLDRSPHHVLLLHENDLAALFVGDLVAELQTRGWRIVPASVAFTDPISDREPNTLSLGQGRIAALAHEQGEAPANLVSPTEDEEYLRERFENEVLSDSGAR